MFNSLSIREVALSIVLLSTGIAAEANTLSLSYSTTAAGTTGSGAVTDIDTSEQYFFANSFGRLTEKLPTAGHYEFYDDYVFNVGDSSISAITSTLNFGNIFAVQNFQARLYDLSGNSALPVLGNPVGGEIDALAFKHIFGTNTVEIFNDVPLNAGTYVLEIRGSVSGFGGAYIGELSTTPVPLPPAAWLMGSAAVALIGIRRRDTATSKINAA